MSSGVVGILLAAGQGTRFGSDKRLYPLDDCTPMAVASARPLCAALSQVIAVVEDPQTAVARLLAREGLRVIANPLAHNGIGTSIACAVAASTSARGWIIALADMPFIPASVIRALAGRLEGGIDIVAPVYRGQRGHPVGFAARHASALMQLHGDEGARSIIAANSSTLELIEVQEEGVIMDIDVPVIGKSR